MNRLPRKLSFGIAAALTLVGCGEGLPDDEEHARVEQAVTSVCSNVAGVYFVDGIPAYAQCTASSNSPIYSNNGIDTATNAPDSDWKQTQYSGGYQCTELLHRYWLFHWNINWIPNGNAGTWCNTTPPSTSGLVKTTTPVHGDAIVFAPGVCGADTTYGHVALIDTVDTAGSKVTFVEQNNAGRRTSAWSCATCFFHVVANTGSGGATGTGGASGAGVGGTAVQLSTSVTSGGHSAIGGSTFTGGSIAVGGAPSSGGSPSAGGRSSGALGGTTATVATTSIQTNGGMGSTTNNSLIPKGGATTVASGGFGNNSSTIAAATGGAAVVTTTPPVGSLGGTPASLNSATGASVSSENAADPTEGCSCSVPNRSPVNAFASLLMSAVGISFLRRQN